MRLKPLTLCAVLLLAACSDPNPPTNAAGERPAKFGSSTSPTTANDTGSLALQLDMIFIDSDPRLSSSATIARGVLRVGDDVEYLTESGKRVAARITEITLNEANGETRNVEQAKAGDEVFVVFELPTKGLAENGAGLAAPGSVVDYAALTVLAKAAAKPAEAKPEFAPRWGTASYRYAGRETRVRDPQVVISRGLGSQINLLDFAWTEDWGDTHSMTKPRDRDAERAITKVEANSTLMFALDLSFEEPGGQFTSVHFVFDDLKPVEFGKGPVERHYQGVPRLLGPGLNAVADERTGPAYDASKAWLSIDTADLANGRFTGRFSATLQRRPEDLIQGHYEPDQNVQIEAGTFEVDLSKVQ